MGLSRATRAFFQLVDWLEMSDEFGQVLVKEDQIIFIQKDTFEISFFSKNDSLNAVLVSTQGEVQQWYFVFERAPREYNFLPTEVSLRPAVSDVSLETAVSFCLLILFPCYQTVKIV